MARHWVEQGAEFLHLVDLDGARSGRVENRASIEAILQAVSVPCELGGGIRDADTIADLLKLGVARLVIGTKALERTRLVPRCLPAFPRAVGAGHRRP